MCSNSYQSCADPRSIEKVEPKLKVVHLFFFSSWLIIWQPLKQQHCPKTHENQLLPSRCQRAVWMFSGGGQRAGRVWRFGDQEEALICPGVAPWTPSHRENPQAPELCAPCSSPRPPCSRASSAALSWTWGLVLAAKQGETAPCRTGGLITLC